MMNAEIDLHWNRFLWQMRSPDVKDQWVSCYIQKCADGAGLLRLGRGSSQLAQRHLSVDEAVAAAERELKRLKALGWKEDDL